MTILDEDEVVVEPEPTGGDASAGPETVLLARAAEGLEAAWLAARLRHGQRDILHVARDGGRIRFLAGMVALMAPEIEILEIPAWDCLPYDRISPSVGIMAERLRALARLADRAEHRPRLILTTANAPCRESCGQPRPPQAGGRRSQRRSG